MPTSDNCEWCGSPMRLAYPGWIRGKSGSGDPECGPARPSCGTPPCEAIRESIEIHSYYMKATAADVMDEAYQENGWFDEDRLDQHRNLRYE